MEENRHYRAVNMLIATIGTFACIGSGFLPAKEGMLGDRSLSIMQDMSPKEVMIWLAVPAVLSVMTLILVAGARFRALMLLTSLAAGAMYLYTDAGYVMAGQNFPGILLNAAGVVLLLTGTALQIFATPAKNGIAAVNAKNGKYKDRIEDAQTGEVMTAFYGSAAAPEAKGADAGSAKNPAASDTKETAEPQEAEKKTETPDPEKSEEPADAEKDTVATESKENAEPADAEKEAEKSDTTESAEPQEEEKKTETPEPEKNEEPADSEKNTVTSESKETAEPADTTENAEPEKKTETPETEKSEDPADAEKDSVTSESKENAELQGAEKKTETVDISEKLAEADEAILKAEEAAAEDANTSGGKASAEKSWDTEEELISLLSELIDEEKKDTEKKDLPEISSELKGELAEIFAEINKGDN